MPCSKGEVFLGYEKNFYAAQKSQGVSQLMESVTGVSQAADSQVAADAQADDLAEMSRLLDEGFVEFSVGEIISAKVVRIDRDAVMVGVGHKSEISIPISQFFDVNGELAVAPDDTIDVLVERWNPNTGGLSLSYSKVLRRKVWDEVIEAHEKATPVKAKILSRIKGGLEVLIGDTKSGLKGFMPLSQIDIRQIPNPEELIGQEIEGLIIKCNRKRENIVLSKRALMEKDRDAKKQETLAHLEVGQVREGMVKNILDYGMFVDIGGIDGMLHVSDISWGRIESPAKHFKSGDHVTVKVLSYDPEKEKISLGIKQLTEDPWLTAEQKYPVGAKVTGKAVSLIEYGAFVELEPGVEGMIHVSEMSWTKRIRRASDVMKVGDVVDAVVLKVDMNAKKISLGLKQVQANPWDSLEEKFPIGTVIEGAVKNVTEFGVFIGIEEGIDGLVHLSDLTWSKKITHPNQLYKKGDVIQAVVLNIDKEKERFSLGVKQLVPDPWATVPERYPIGSVVTGKITNVKDFGVFVEIEDGVEGLIHVSEVSAQKINTPVGIFEPGQEVKAKVINISTVDRRIGLSLKRIAEDEERSTIEEYKQSVSAATTIGGLIREEMVSKKKSNK